MDQPRNLKSNLNMYKRGTQQEKGRLKTAYENAYARALVRALHSSKQCLYVYICFTPNAIAVPFQKTTEEAAMSRRLSHLWRYIHTSVHALRFKTMLTYTYLYSTPNVTAVPFQKVIEAAAMPRCPSSSGEIFFFCANVLYI
jgi:hypothetical protein